MPTDDEKPIEAIGQTVAIVRAYVSNNSIGPGDVAGLIADIYAAVGSLAAERNKAEAEAPMPAVSIQKSLTADCLICLEDGKQFKSLKGHLKTAHGMTPDEYREKWGLPSTSDGSAELFSAALDLGKKGRIRTSRTAKKSTDNLDPVFMTYWRAVTRLDGSLRGKWLRAHGEARPLTITFLAIQTFALYQTRSLSALTNS